MKVQALKFFATLSVFFTLAAQASNTFPITAFDEGFYKGKAQLPKAPARLSEALAASVRLTAPSGLACSSALISPDGHIITALHCVMDCLRSKGFTEITQVLTGAMHSIRDQSPNVVCKTYEYEELETVGVRILYTGRGLFYPENLFKPEQMPSAELRKMIEWEEDYAILKIEPTVKSKGDFDCVPLAKHQPRVGAWVWGIGYPGTARRKNGYSSNGEDEYIRYGKVRSQMDRKLLEEEYGQGYADYILRRYSSPRLMITNMDIQNGVSGGMVINGKSELVGITVEGASDKAGYRGATSAELRVSAVVKSLKNLGADVREIFSCPSR